MKPAQDILDELLSVSPGLAGISNKNVFYVPDGYFNSLSDKLATKVSLLTIETTLSAPAGYFDTLSNRILNKIKGEQNAGEEIQEISPVLYDLQKVNVYKVPLGYFDLLIPVVLRKINPPPARVIQMHKRSIWKYAVAAIMTGVISMNALWMFNKSTQEVGSYSQTENPSLLGYINASYKYQTEDQINEGISNLSNDEIVSYLEKTGTVADNEELSKGVDPKDLPSQQDYLNDDQTLETLLDKINNKN